MNKSTSTHLSIGVAGLGIGWLIGLSATPVIAAVIATLLAAAAALAGASTGQGTRPVPLHVAHGSLAVLVLGISIAATCGMEYRLGTWFGAHSNKEDLEGVVKRWVALGADKQDVVKRLLDRELPAQSAHTTSEAATKGAVPRGLVADAASGDVCGEIAVVAPNAIWSTLAASTNPKVQAFGTRAVALKLPESFAEQLRGVWCAIP